MLNVCAITSINTQNSPHTTIHKLAQLGIFMRQRICSLRKALDHTILCGA